MIAWTLPEGYEPGDGIAANLLTQDDYYFYGVLMADYAAATTKTGNIHFVGLPTFPVLSIVQQGFTDEIATACPTCTVEVSEVAVTDIGTNLPGQITSALQANPDLDMIVYAFGGMLYGVPDALDAAGLMNQAKAVSQAGGPLNFGFIANDQHQVAEVALASELLGWRAIDAAARVLAGEGPGRAETPANAVVDGHPDILSGGLPCYATYRTADGRYLAVGALEPKFWQAFCMALGRADLIARGWDMGPKRDAAVAEVAEVIATKTLAEWDAILADVDACATPVLTLAESLEHPNARARGMVIEVDGGGAKTTQYALPIRMTGFDFAVRRPPPLLGEHNAELGDWA